jgi:DNA-directed RNA polymerase I subunit RPA2
MEVPSFNYLRPENFNKLNDKDMESLVNLTKFHIDSFDWMVDEGLSHAIKRIPPVEFKIKNGSVISYRITDAKIFPPTVAPIISSRTARDKKLYPTDCRQLHTTYSGKIFVTVEYSHDGHVIDSHERCVGQIPVMVKSKLCNLYKLTPKELVGKGEEQHDLGGYFVIKGNEKLLRLLILPRRNYVRLLKVQKNFRSVNDP